MQCPYCGGELEAGNLSVDNGRYMGDVYWLPEGEEPPNGLLFTKIRVEKKGGFLLTENAHPSIPAAHCPACKKLIISYE